MADIPTNGSLDAPDFLDATPTSQVYTTGSLIPDAPKIATPLPRLNRRSVIIAVSLLLISLGVAGWTLWSHVRSQQQNVSSNDNNSVTSRYQPLNVTLDDLAKDGSLVIDNAPSLSINGQLKINNSLIISPTSPPPANGVAGQIYYDPQLNVLRYYNGSSFTSLVNDKTPIVNSLGGTGGNISIGDGLSLSNGRLTAAAAIPSAVTSIQGRTGSINFTSGGGIAIDGTTLSNTGVTGLDGRTGNISLGHGLAINNGSLTNTGVNGLASGSPSLLIANDGSGNLTITDSGGSSGVTSPGGTTNRLARFTGAQAIGDSSISDNGTLVSVTGNLAVSGSLALGTLLSVGNGGTGTASLANNGILLGQGTGPLTAVTAAGSGLCLMSTAGAPAFQACPGSTAVTSLDSLTGALSIANSSGSGTTVTIDNASTSQKGIAQFNSANFSVAGGTVNTIQNIGSGATPTFAGVNATSAYQVNGVGGAATTCSGGQFLQNAVVAGGIVTGGGCAAVVGDGGVTAVGTIDSQTKSADGAVIVGTNLYMQTADASNPGLVSTGAQTFAGAKTFAGALNANAGATIQSAADANISAFIQGRTTQTAATLLIKTGSSQSGDALRINDSTNSRILSIDQFGFLEQVGRANFDSYVGIGSSSAAVTSTLLNIGNAVGTKKGLEVTGNFDQTADLAQIHSGNSSATTVTNNLLVERDLAGGATTNGINITRTAGTLTNGLAFTGTIGTDITRGSGTLSINGASGVNLQNAGSTIAAVSSTGVSVNGLINSTSKYQINGTDGVTITCTGGQLLQNATTVGGIVTGGSCVTGGAGGGVTTVGTIDSQTKSADGAVIVGTSIYLQTADATNPGLVNTGTQTFAGAKTFNGAITANSTYNTNTFTSSALTFGSASTATVSSASGQGLNLTGNGASAFSTTAGALSLSAAAGQSILIGTANSNIITLGAATATNTITVGQSTSSNTINIGNATIGAGNTGTINIGTSSTGTGKTVVAVGSTNAGSSTTIQAGTGNINLTSIGTTGGTVVKSATSNSTGAFQVQNASSVAILNYDTTVNSLSLRSSSATSPAVSVLNSDGTVALEVRSGGSGQLNTIVGNSAGAAVTTGSSNSAFGSNSLKSTTTGGSNTAVGSAALNTNISGSSNTAVGNHALYSNTGSGNIGIGDNAAGNTTGGFNAVGGYYALYFNTTGIANTAFGTTALYQNVGNNNVAIGINAGYNLTTGNYNTIIGSDAGSTDNDGFATPNNLAGSTLVGIQAQAQQNSSLILGGAGSQAVNVGIGTTKPDNRFSVSPAIYGAGGLAGNSTTASQAGTTVTGIGGTVWTSNGVKVGQQIIFANGNSAYITAINSNTSLTVDVSQTVATQHYRIHDPSFQVSDTGNVAIGTATIGGTYRLDIQNASQNSLMRIYQNDGQYAETVLQTDNANFDIGVGGTNSNVNDSGSFFIYNDNAGSYGLSLSSSGNVGIGGLAGNQSTTKLDVNGLIRVRNPNGETAAPTRANNGEFAFADLGGTNQRLYFRTNGANYFINRSGTGDYSEYFLKQDGHESLRPGYMTTVDNGKVTKATQKSSILGVVSDYGTRNNDDLNDGLRGKDPAYQNVGLLGQLPVIVTNEKGKITAGDPVMSSSKLAGIGTKMDHPGAIVGRTLQDFSPDNNKCTPIASIESAPWTTLKENAYPDAQCFRLPDGTLVGRVMAYVNAQYYTPPMQGNDISNLQSDIKNLGVNIQTKKATIGDLKVTGSATINGKLTVKGLSEVQDLQLDGHLITKGNKPSVKLLAAAGAGTATNTRDSHRASVSITGNDTAGTITLVVGDNPKADDLVKLAFAKAFGNTPQIVISPIGKASTALEPYINDPSSKGFTLGSLQAPQAGHTYKFTYYAVQ